MNKITQFDKASATMVGKEVEAAMRAIAEKYGLTVKAGGGKYGNDQFKPSCEFLVQGEIGSSKKEESAWKQLAEVYGLDPSLLGRVFMVNGEKFRVDGLLPSRSKNCVKITRMRDQCPRVCSVMFVKGGTFAPAT